MVQSRLNGLDDRKLLSWYAFYKEHGLKNSSNVFPLFQDCNKIYYSASCLKNEALNHWNATRVSLDDAHRLAVCSHFERRLPLSLCAMVLKSVQSALSDLKRPPERLQSQCNYRPFIT